MACEHLKDKMRMFLESWGRFSARLGFIIILSTCGLVVIVLADQGVNPVLRISGAESGSINISRDIANFYYRFEIVSINETPVEKLSVSVSPFIGPNSALTETSYTINNLPGDNNVQIPGLGTATLEIRASLPTVGTYNGSIALVYANRRETVSLVVTRTRVAPSVEMLGLESVMSTSGLCLKSSLCNDVQVRFTLQETAGLEVSLNPPLLTTLVLNESNKGKVQAPNYSVEFQTENEPASSNLKLGPGESKRFNMLIHGLVDPGEYTGTLRVTAPDAQPIDSTFKVFVRMSGFIAASLIFLGVLISYLIRLYAKSARPKFIKKQRILSLISEMDRFADEAADLEEEEKGVVAKLRRSLDGLYEEIDLGLDKDAESLLIDIERKLSLVPLWLSALRRVETVQPPELKIKLRNTLNEVKDTLVQERTPQATLDEKERVLRGFDTMITTEIRDYLLEQLNTFKKEVEEWISRGARQELTQELRDNVIPRIDEALDLASGQKLAEARSAFETARLVFVRLNAVDLADTIAASPTPPGFDQEEWNNLQGDVSRALQEVQKETDADHALAVYRDAGSYYLRQLASKLKEEVNQYKLVINSSESLDDKENSGLLTKLGAVADLLDEALIRLDGQSLREASQQYEKARVEYDLVIASLNVRGQKMQRDETPPVAGAISLREVERAAGDQPITTIVRGAARRRPTVEELTKRMRLYDVIFNAVILATAVFLGLKILWADNLIWGSFNDYFAALLWGLGLHQVSGVAFEGVAGLGEKLAK